MNEALFSQLRAAVGAANVLTEGDLEAWEQDWRKRTRGKALAVVRPGYGCVNASPVAGMKAPKTYPLPRRP